MEWLDAHRLGLSVLSLSGRNINGLLFFLATGEGKHASRITSTLYPTQPLHLRHRTCSPPLSVHTATHRARSRYGSPRAHRSLLLPRVIDISLCIASGALYNHHRAPAWILGDHAFRLGSRLFHGRHDSLR